MTDWVVDPGNGVTLANTAYETFPDIVCLPDGKLIATWSTQVDHFDTAGVGKMRTSTDGGATWSAAVTTVTDTAMTNHGNRVARLNINLSLGTRRPWLYLSNDGGVTWSSGAQITGWGNSEWIFPADLAWHDDGTPDGLLLCTVYGPEGVRVMGSTDAGGSWDFRAVAKQGLTWSDATEACTHMTPSGDLIMLLRNDTAQNIEILRSTDQGYSWSAPTVALANTSGLPRMTRMPGGSILVTLRDATPGAAYPEHWVMGVSLNDGATWSRHHINDEWMMYGRFVPMPDGSARLVGSSQQRDSSTRARAWVRTVSSTVINVTINPHDSHVELDITNLPVGTATITVERVVGADVRPVRGGRDRVVAGTGDLIRDWEIPFGVDVTYRVTAHSAAGGDLGTGFAQHQLPNIERPWLWISDPLEENSARLVMALDGTDATRTTSTRVDQVVPLGLRIPSVSVASRARLGEWPLQLVTKTQEESDALRGFLDNAAFILIRPPAGIGLPPLLYGAPAAVTETPHETGLSRWDLPLTVSGGPLVHIIAWAWTYEDLADLGMLYGDLPVMFPTYRELQRGPA